MQFNLMSELILWPGPSRTPHSWLAPTEWHNLEQNLAQLGKVVMLVCCGRELLEITEKLIRDMPTELPGSVRDGATALQLLKGAKNEEVCSRPGSGHSAWCHVWILPMS